MGALPTELTMIKNSGTPFEPMDAGRITTWMDPSDKYIDSWFDHLVNKDVPCCVAKKSNGQLAVFRAASDVKDVPADGSGEKRLHEKPAKRADA